MKIVFTGGGTGGHFYPLIAIAESVRLIAREQRLVKPSLYYVAPSAFDEEALFENEIRFVMCPAGKWRRYFSLRNFLDLFVSAAGLVSAIITLFSIYPDIVMSKGGYASVPVTMAARILRIPVVIHESDVKPGRANLMASKFATRIGVAFPETANAFPQKARSKIAHTGIPVRAALASVETEGAKEHFGLDPTVPTILVLGGSSGAARVNDVVLAALAELTSFANVIHQTGKDHFKAAQSLATVMLEKSAFKQRYHPFPYLNTLSMRRAAGAADLVVSRAGMTAIAEIAHWKKPAILIPIPEAVSHDQRTNAYAYGGAGAATVIEEANLTDHILVSETKRLIENPELGTAMAEKGFAFAAGDAARVIAEELVRLSLKHDAEAAQG
jgi:UDP-N-acetylglucosamine--N-acetylmuramyl-(pentapeptide) pyrophosphoryl-undecaprenol N-acetylglucosamine transferase